MAFKAYTDLHRNPFRRYMIHLGLIQDYIAMKHCNFASERQNDPTSFLMDEEDYLEITEALEAFGKKIV
jgi:hypothetical protein